MPKYYPPTAPAAQPIGGSAGRAARVAGSYTAIRHSYTTMTRVAALMNTVEVRALPDGRLQTFGHRSAGPPGVSRGRRATDHPCLPRQRPDDRLREAGGARRQAAELHAARRDSPSFRLGPRRLAGGGVAGPAPAASGRAAAPSASARVARLRPECRVR